MTENWSCNDALIEIKKVRTDGVTPCLKDISYFLDPRSGRVVSLFTSGVA